MADREDRIEEAAKEMVGAGCVCAGRQSMRPILQRLYDDGKKAGAEEYMRKVGEEWR